MWRSGVNYTMSLPIELNSQGLNIDNLFPNKPIAKWAYEDM